MRSQVIGFMPKVFTLFRLRVTRARAGAYAIHLLDTTGIFARVVGGWNAYAVKVLIQNVCE
jgi:hypothetical protein